MSETYLFIEAIDFTSNVRSYFGSDEAYAEFQAELAVDPDKESVIPGAAPIRKIRWGDRRRGMGKQGGLRVIYIHIPDIRVLFMLDLISGRLNEQRKERTSGTCETIDRRIEKKGKAKKSMSTNIKRSPLAERLKQGLVEGIEFSRGDLDLTTTIVPAGRTFSGEEVVAIRIRRHMSQAQFANLLAVNVKTLQSWEQGARKPSKPTMRLLQIFDAPEEFRTVLALESDR